MATDINENAEGDTSCKEQQQRESPGEDECVSGGSQVIVDIVYTQHEMHNIQY